MLSDQPRLSLKLDIREVVYTGALNEQLLDTVSGVGKLAMVLAVLTSRAAIWLCRIAELTLLH